MKIKDLIWIAVIILIISSSCSTGTKRVTLKTEIDTASYYLGVSVGKSLRDANNLDEVNVDALASAIRDVYAEAEDLPTDMELNAYLNTFFEKRFEEANVKNLEEGRAFLEENKSKEGVMVTESGLQYKIIEPGTGRTPVATDSVKCNYRGTLIDGEEFDSSYSRGEPAVFAVTGVIKGWQEAIQMMKEGAKWEIYVPTELGYGTRVRPGGKIQPNMALIFEIELIEITNK
ncbi:MAG: FKBP-type peptidyl-prolyl cis-trans isomerase [Bacteroidales bacterium]|nr:FKBP-type peptidyl-prolyl cis-trans isomerase [Bacteroidales bacterium]